MDDESVVSGTDSTGVVIIFLILSQTFIFVCGLCKFIEFQKTNRLQTTVSCCPMKTVALDCYRISLVTWLVSFLFACCLSFLVFWWPPKLFCRWNKILWGMTMTVTVTVTVTHVGKPVFLTGNCVVSYPFAFRHGNVENFTNFNPFASHNIVFCKSQ